MNKYIDICFKELNKYKIDAYIFSLSNENLFEFVDEKDNELIELTGFTGDTGELLVCKNKAYLIVDGRFTVQAKKEVNDNRIKIITTDGNYTKEDLYNEVFKYGDVVGFNSLKKSISFVYRIIDLFADNGIIFKPINGFLKKTIDIAKKNYFYMSSAPLFALDKKSVTYNASTKIRKCIELIKEQYGSKNPIYITSSLEEIAYLTNLRYKFCDINNHNVLFNAFMIVDKKNILLYINDYLDENAVKYVKQNKIFIKRKNDFYKDLKKYSKKKDVYLDPDLNNYHIGKLLMANENNYINSPLTVEMSLKGKVEISNLRKCNILDGVAMVKSLFTIKESAKRSNDKFKNEYEVKNLIDNTRKEVGKNKFLCPSFPTIVAYKENSAICHYSPSKNKSKKLKKESILLIDSGGNYTIGSTDITRTISLYKNKKDIDDNIIKHYSMVLNAMLTLSRQIYPSGFTGTELDAITRSSLYNEYLDFEHGTGHGIGYISNIHEGPNRISPIIKDNYEINKFLPNQVESNEPGLYFEGKYGIRIENDLLNVKANTNKHGEFLKFETLTLCPYDRDLIDVKYISKENIEYLNKYNKIVYNKLNKYLDIKERKWLKEQTNVFR